MGAVKGVAVHVLITVPTIGRIIQIIEINLIIWPILILIRTCWPIGTGWFWLE